MANYSQDFQTQAQGLLGLVKGKLSETIGWKPLPGQLNKIAASSGGFVWGFNVNGDYYTCREPCDGNNWTLKTKPPGMVGMPMDIAVDSQTVYTLFTGTVTSAPTSTPTADVPKFYTEYNYGGTGVPLGAGNYPFIKLVQSIRNDSVSSIRIPKGFSVTIYQDDIGSRNITLTSDVPDLRTLQFDKSISAVKITGSATVSSPPPAATTNQLSFATQPVDGTGRWHVQSIPGDVPANTEINVTDQFIFVGSQGCSKPCTTGNWVTISSPPGSGQSMGVVAASSGSTYVPVNTGGQIKVYSGAGNGQGGWTPQPGLAGKIPIAVEADSQFLYAQDPGSGGLYRCSTPYSDPASCQLQDTGGLSVMGHHTVSVNPRSYQTYLTASSGGQYGNIFQRLDEGGLNVAPVMEQAKKYTSQMDSDVNALGGAVSSQDAQLSAAKTREEAIGIINQMTNISDDIYNKKVKSGTVRQKVLTDGPDGPSIYRQRVYPLQILLATLLVVIVLYFVTVMFVSPMVSMGLSIGVLVVGTGAAIYYAV